MMQGDTERIMREGLRQALMEAMAIRGRRCHTGAVEPRGPILRPWSLRRFPGFIEPCLPSRAARPPSGPLWVHEIKHDGYRLMVRRDGSRVRCFTRNGHEWADRFPTIVDATHLIKARRAARPRARRDFPMTSTMRVSVPPPADGRASCRLRLGGFLQTVFRDLLPPILRKNKHP